MRKRLGFLALVVVTVFVIAVGLLALSGEQDHPTGSANQQSENTADAERESGGGDSQADADTIKDLVRRTVEGKQYEPDGVRALSQGFFDAKDATTALEAIEALELAGFADEAQLFKGWLVGQCPPGFAKHTAALEQQQWIVERKRSFCGNFEASEDEFVEKLAWEPLQVEMKASQMMQAMKGLDLQRQTDYLLRQIENASSWLDLEAVKYTIRNAYPEARATNQWSDTAVHPLGQAPQYQGEQARDIQTTALTLLQCIEYIDCGPSSPYTLSICYTQPFCESGWSLYDFFYQTHSPLENDQIFSVLQLLVALRQNRW